MGHKGGTDLSFLVREERIHEGGDFGANYQRDRIIYQAEQEGEKKRPRRNSPGSELGRAQCVKNRV